jgi:hypothetical protein
MLQANNILPCYKSIGEFYENTIRGAFFCSRDLVSPLELTWCCCLPLAGLEELSHNYDAEGKVLFQPSTFTKQFNPTDGL